ncbi:MAG TPA: hypothetical protein VJ577_05870 [Burkholderiaceae bacterium]|nr:hypothetical protein [Burkholderiaceae bacterium]
MKSLLLGTGFAATMLLNGCAVYGPPQAYSDVPYYQNVPVYGQPGYPQTVYMEPAPIYVGPPVTFGFNFGYWSGGGHGRHGWGHHHH